MRIALCTLSAFAIAMALVACGSGSSSESVTVTSLPSGAIITAAEAETTALAAPTQTEVAIAEATSQAKSALDSFAEGYAGIADRYNAQLEDLNIALTAALDSEDFGAIAGAATSVHDAIAQARQEYLALEVPAEIKQEYDALFETHTAYELAYGSLAQAAEDENISLMLDAAERLRDAGVDWVVARDLLRKAIGLPPAED